MDDAVTAELEEWDLQDLIDVFVASDEYKTLEDSVSNKSNPKKADTQNVEDESDESNDSNTKESSESDASKSVPFATNAFWKRASLKHGNRFVVPLNFFCDEADMGDPLGTHAGVNTILCAYLTIPCLPPHFTSRLYTIFLCLLCYANDRKVFGNQAIFQNLITEINLLKQNGDSLGINGIFGFVECFVVWFFCRICKVDKETCNVHYVNVRHESHVYIMHNHWEGVVPNDLAKHTFIIELKIFNLEILNKRISTFDYGKYESKVPEIKFDHLKNKQLRLPAAESATFCRCFVLLVSGLMPKDNEKAQKVWQLYIFLGEVSDIISSPRMSSSYPDLL
ncbi:hypothetical protein QAD02_011701 [Eretmocerus hayati]|uniref:Uncharacterized protein n=1 Tax=Eretmocerus hayati TaxID=131215 RepID=A0ACC2P2C4_9HYME|nr:hypothetical protein QAD02_011701 [Eretmocerus hayati]